MQSFIRSSSKSGIKKSMPQASLPPLNVAVSAPTNAPLTPTTPGTGIMPSITRETLAMRLRQNWLAKHPIDPPLPTTATATDDSLTSLNWLQNLNIMKMASPTPPASPQPSEYTPTMQVNPNAVLNMGCTTTTSALTSPSPIKIKQEPGMASNTVAPPRINHFMDIMPPASPGLDKIDYKTNASVKPPYSYATLICMAMKETKKNKITLAGIYTWITENFMYYKVADPSWQNSIRHNLSLNKCFQKVPRRKDEPGKGGFWRINPEYEDMFINGIFKKRRGSASGRDLALPVSTSQPSKRVRRDEDDSDSSVSNGPSAKIQKLSVKTEPEDYSGVLEDGIDFNWNSILNQDINVNGIKVKTEDLIDTDADIASPITAMSPPPSEGSNSEDMTLDDFFNNTDFSSEPLDFTTGGPLDLSINGMSLKPPQWWEESFNLGSVKDTDNGLHTPIHVAQSPVHDTEYAHPWAEDKTELDNAIACIDTDIAGLFGESS